ncbi:MAG TPA: CehA/McbA family metallohydrolase [Planctomycetaceae bacterium]|nr:CehA/McbA family metallohydrolase [Planctomycetaceae bacterium]
MSNAFKHGRNVLTLLALLVPLSMITAKVTCAEEASHVVTNVERQPLVAATRRLVEAMDFAGAPFSAEIRQKIADAAALPADKDTVKQLQQILDPLCLAFVNINAESRVKVSEGPVAKELMQQGWRAFLIKVHNEAGINPVLQAESPNALPVYQKGKGAREEPRKNDKLVNPEDVPDRFLDLNMLQREPLKEKLSGLLVEYRVLLLYSRDAGEREASLSFHIGAGTQDIGFRNAVPILFTCGPAVDVTLQIHDVDGEPTTANFIIRDTQGRIYPLPSRRLAPDFFFHDQVYRSDGESVMLPPGEYSFVVNRGPEYLPQRMKISVADAAEQTVKVDLKRWIHIAKYGWYSGDHHVHAAGCAHYDSPTEGVGPEAMMRHILGEDLNVGCVLSWGPCWYTQKEYFNGQVSDLSTRDYLMRYDVEVSGFPSSHAGHLCLLKLKEDDYPGTTRLEQWPSWTLPVLKWGRDQGGVVGYSHSGWGLALPDVMPDGSRKFPGQPWGGAPEGWPGKAVTKLPDYEMPRFDGIGANEFIVTTAHNVCDFISAVDTPAIWELNIWYHTLNCGMTTRISGETDFPCIYGDRVGLGRIYVQLDKGQELTYDTWVEGLRDGRSYCGDGLSHLLDFKVNDVAVGQQTPDAPLSTLKLDAAKTVNVTFNAAAMLEDEPTALTESIRNKRLDEKPYWHLERSRIGATRNVPVEIIVNGEVVATRELLADGHVEAMNIPVEITQSSWVAVRILPSVHTNPVFVTVGGKPIRASRRSAEWCEKAVGVCWESKQNNIRPQEREAAKLAYDQAAAIYAKIREESAK